MKYLRKIAGFSILAAIFGGLFIGMTYTSGLGVALGVYLTCIGLCSLIALAVYLIDEGTLG